jgi:probable F420-dependent oxidoreductase
MSGNASAAAAPGPAAASQATSTARGRTGVLLGSWPTGLPTDGGFYASIGRQVEADGYDLLFCGDHLFMHGPNPEAFCVLATYAAVTKRVLIGTGVLLAALRDPVVTAKQVASLDYLSGGRMVFGVGVGGEIEQEWRAAGVSRHDRGRRTDEYLDLMRQLWSGEVVDHHGAFRDVEGVVGSPLPVQAGGPPIWIGGRSDAALRRAAKHQGWCAYAMSPRRLAEGVSRIAELRGGVADCRISYVLFTVVDSSSSRAREMAGAVLSRRYQQDFQPYLDAICAVGDAAEVRRRVEEYRAAGVDDILLSPQVPADEMSDQLGRLAEVLEVASRR